MRGTAQCCWLSEAAAPGGPQALPRQDLGTFPLWLAGVHVGTEATGNLLPAPSHVCLLGSAIRAVAKNTAPGAALPAGEWGTVQLRGSWRVGQTAGGSRNFASYPTNPCFPFSVPEGPGPRCVRITLHQHCRPSDTEFHPIGFHIFQASSLPQGGRGSRRGPQRICILASIVPTEGSGLSHLGSPCPSRRCLEPAQGPLPSPSSQRQGRRWPLEGPGAWEVGRADPGRAGFRRGW